MKKSFAFAICLVFSLSITACDGSVEPTDSTAIQHADLIIAGEHIISMDPANPEVGAVAITGDKIVRVGSRESVFELADDKTRIVELGERALLPGFIDAHGHFSFVARSLDTINLASPPVGTATNIEDILELLRTRLDQGALEKGEWLSGFGYDDSLLAENRHLTRDDLDQVSNDVPIAIVHISGHLAVANSTALRISGLTAETENPPGGVIRRHPGSNEPNGVLEETAAMAVTFGRVFSSSGEAFMDQARRAVPLHARHGITTIQDGGASMADIQALKAAAASRPFDLDIAAYPYVGSLSDEEFQNLRHNQNYSGGFRVAGAKFSLDGSPQGRTAWVTLPYDQGPPGAAADYRAFPTMDLSLYRQRAAHLLDLGIPFLAHANGDAAIDAMLDGLEEVGQDTDHRSVIIHAQLMRADQIDRAKTLGAVPSFFSAHPFFWGDWHRLSFGDDRASNISPVGWAVDADLPFTIHNDAPVVPPDIMRLIWVAVNRQTRKGHVLGEHQRATVTQALHAVTLGAAYQYFEEGQKGSITSGKQADLVILGESPLTADPATLADIPIIETIARGQTVYSQAAQ